MFHFEMEHPVRWADLDVQGVVNNAVYLSMMEHGRWEYFDHVHPLSHAAVPFTIATVNVTFVKPGRIGRRTNVRVRTTKLGDSSFEMGYEITQDDDIVVRALATLVWMEGNRPATIPDEVRQSIAQFEQIDPGPN